MSETQANITSTMQEHRLFPPKPEFSAKAHIKSREEYDRLYRESIDNPEKFWGRVAEVRRAARGVRTTPSYVGAVTNRFLHDPFGH